MMQHANMSSYKKEQEKAHGRGSMKAVGILYSPKRKSKREIVIGFSSYWFMLNKKGDPND